MTEHQQRLTLAACARLLSQLLYYPPKPEFLGQFIEGAISEWPRFNDTTALGLRVLSLEPSNGEIEQLKRDYTQLFVGPGPLKAYPWGSTYLDRDRQLFGDSERSLKLFCQNQGIEITTEQNEPCDHIGLVLMMLALLLDNDDQQFSKAPVQQLLDEHLSKWLELFCTDLSANAQTGFYRGVSLLLSGLVEELNFHYSSLISTLEVS